MALTPSNMIALGSLAPDFALANVLDDHQKLVCRQEVAGKLGLVVVFTCNHCPYVLHLQEKLVEVATIYLAKGIGFVAINANDPKQYPEDSPANMRLLATKYHYPFPYLFDETQEVARSFNAACTPDFFLYDSCGRLVYRGQFDDGRPGTNRSLTGYDLTKAMDHLIAGQEISLMQVPSSGCSIKWK